MSPRRVITTPEMEKAWVTMQEAGIVPLETARAILEPFRIANKSEHINKLLKKRGFPPLDNIAIYKCGLDVVDKLDTSTKNCEGTRYAAAGLGMPSTAWTLCVYGPTDEEDANGLEEKIAWKGWRKANQEIPKQAEYSRRETEEGHWVLWVEPVDDGHDIPNNGRVGGKASSEEKLDDSGEVRNKVSATVLEILQRGISESATAGREEYWWFTRGIEGDPDLGGI